MPFKIHKITATNAAEFEEVRELCDVFLKHVRCVDEVSLDAEKAFGKAVNLRPSNYTGNPIGFTVSIGKEANPPRTFDVEVRGDNRHTIWIADRSFHLTTHKPIPKD